MLADAKPEFLTEIATVRMIPTDLDYATPLPSKVYIDNVYKLAMALLMGKSATGIKILECTSSNILKVANVGVGYETYASYPNDGTLATAPDAFDTTALLRIDDGASRWDILIETFDAVIDFRNAEDVAFGHDIILPKGMYSIEFSSQECRVRNRTAGSAAKFQITAYS